MKGKYLLLILAFLPLAALFLGTNILYQEMLALKHVPDHIENLYDFVMCFPTCQNIYGKHTGGAPAKDVPFYVISFAVSILCMLLAGGVGVIEGKAFHVLYFLFSGGVAGFFLHATFSSWELWIPGVILTCIQIAHTAIACAPFHNIEL